MSAVGHTPLQNTQGMIQRAQEVHKSRALSFSFFLHLLLLLPIPLLIPGPYGSQIVSQLDKKKRSYAPSTKALEKELDKFLYFQCNVRLRIFPFFYPRITFCCYFCLNGSFWVLKDISVGDDERKQKEEEEGEEGGEKRSLYRQQISTIYSVARRLRSRQKMEEMFFIVYVSQKGQLYSYSYYILHVRQQFS